jgi:RNA polymerase sigma-70 factor, ECF subfamily
MRQNYLSEDIAQEVLVCIIEKKTKFRADSSVETYLSGIAKNIIRERKHGFKEYSLSANHLEIADKQSDPVTVLENRELSNSIKKAIAKLPQRQRQVIELTYFSNLPPNKIAKQLRCSRSSVHDNLYRARKNLRKKLKAYNPFDYKHI